MKDFRDRLSADATRIGLSDDNHLESLVTADSLVGTDFIDPLAVDKPLGFAKLEERGRVSSFLGKVEGAWLEMNADQGQQVARLPVARPEDLVVPVGRIPFLSFDRVGHDEGRNEPGFQPLSLLMEQHTRVVDVDVLDDLAKWPPKDHPGYEPTKRQDAGPDQQSHGQFLRHLPELASPIFIVESNHRRPQVTVFWINHSHSVRGGVTLMAPATRARRSRKSPSGKFGAHMSIAGGCDRAVLAAHAVEFHTVQLFTKNNNQWKAPTLLAEHIAAFRSSLEQTGIIDPVAHTSYLINLASPDDILWQKSIDAMTVEVERCALLGIADLVVHPGSHMGEGPKAGLARVARGLDEIHRRTEGMSVTIDLETTAGQGTNLGHQFEHLGEILDQVVHPERLGVCADTCHIFAAGYSLGTLEEYHETIDQLERSVGLNRLRVWHLNDSVRDRGSRVDRHAGIGAGRMGLEPFRHLVNDPRFVDVPMILETPKGTEDDEDLDARNLRILRHLVRPARSSRNLG